MADSEKGLEHLGKGLAEDLEADLEELETDLEEELRELGRALRVPDVDGPTMAERVLAQLLAERVPTPVPPPASPPDRWGWLRRWWKALLASFSGLLMVVVLTPPVRATVVEWLGFGGVAVRYEPGTPPAPGSAAGVPGCPDPVPLAEAGRRAGFTPLIPGALGEPDTVTVTGVPPRGVVGLCWRTAEGGAVRLDEFPARLDVGFGKQVRVPPEWVALPDGAEGYWFARPHLLTFPMTDASGSGWAPSVRPAGPTLLWTRSGGTLTLRLEGVADRAEAIRIAASAR
ncbi:hypothetical protein [Streptomyces sp. NPDC101115]|uniref:hypothetical protein n=1 Tax=Streptomyces sp. NPDC101115 TaxID=3366106 RepID=UPI0038035D0D